MYDEQATEEWNEAMTELRAIAKEHRRVYRREWLGYQVNHYRRTSPLFRRIHDRFKRS